MSTDLSTLRSLRPKALGALLRQGHGIDPAALDDSMYRGVSLGIPHWVERLAWTTFVKTFRREPDRLRGWNLRLEQTGLDGAVVPLRRKDGERLTFGHYEVVPGRDRDLPEGSLLVDYGAGGNPLLDPTRLLRDPLVALEPSRVDRLLGWSYLDLGLRVPTPSYFLLLRLGPLDHQA